MTKFLKKKDVEGAKTAYGQATSALDEYLAQVELPAARDVAVGGGK